MKKLVTAILAVTMLAAIMPACGGTKKIDTDQTLEVYCYDAGYGTDWVEKLLDLFAQQTWVKEKYPDLIIPKPTLNDDYSFADTMLSTPKQNTYDVLFACIPLSRGGADSSGKEVIIDLHDVVYEQKVPGEDVLFRDKMDASYLFANTYNNRNDPTAPEQQYFISWAGGMGGILYNEDHLKTLGIKVPNTTNELAAACKKIKETGYTNANGDKKDYAFEDSKQTMAYWNYLFEEWWAQYEGIQGYIDFFSGVHNNRYSKDIFTQQGRVEALKIFENLLAYDKGWIDLSAPTYEYMVAQTMFLEGNGVFYANADWFPSEMSELKADILASGGKDYAIKIMPTPIVSSIVNNLKSITGTDEEKDQKLSAVVDAIDKGETSYDGVSAEDFAKIKEARTVVYSIGALHTAVIPKIATGKDVAIDFLRFMATDVALNGYIEATGGASLPFKYDVKAKNPELYSSLDKIHQSRLDYFNSPYYSVYTLPQKASFPLYMYGNVDAFYNMTFTVFRDQNNSKTPQSFYDDTINIWTEGKWKTALDNAGLS